MAAPLFARLSGFHGNQNERHGHPQHDIQLQSQTRPKTESRGNNESFDSLCEGTAQCDSNGSLQLGGHLSTR